MINKTFAASSAMTLALLASLISVDSYADVGRTSGGGNVSPRGEATYQIPITIPKGINGLQPEFALTYGHRTGEGIAGVGWGLSGLSSIHRCGKTVAQDGETKNVELSTADRFCVDGVQLRLTSGTYGVAGSQYRTEIDTISRYTAGGTAGNGPANFTVEHKNGLTYEYGNSADSRIESLASGWETTAITWELNKIEDRDGNEIVFKYTEDGAPYGAHRINFVTYRSNPGQSVLPGYKVDFLYETQPVDDTDVAYASGGKIEDTKRLERIEVSYIDGPGTVTRRYWLFYESSLSSANRSRLASVKECAGYPTTQTVCFNPTTFTYQDGSVSFDSEVSSGSTITSSSPILLMDVNGDGRTDVVFSSSSGKWVYQFANASGGYDAAVTTSINSTNSAEAIITDHNSDGFADLLVPYSGGTWWAIHGSTAGLQSPVNSSAPDASTAGNATSLDIDGDGRDDLVWADHATRGVYARNRLSTGNGYSSTITTLYQAGSNTTFLNTTVFTGAYEQNKRRNFDVNGDGIHDIAIVTERTGGSRWEPWELQFTDIILGGGAGQYSVKSDTSNGLPIDINGDGYTDIAYRVYNGSLLYRISTGKSFGVQSTGQSLANLNFNLVVAMDWNGDGMQDLLMPNTSTETWFYLESLGNSFAAGEDTFHSSSGAVSTYVVDNNGDGLQDIGYKKTSGSNYTYAHKSHSGVKPDLMTTALGGHGNSISFNYAPLTQSSYTKGTGAIFPDQDYAGSLSVVTSAVSTTGIGTNTFTTTYAYEGARLNVEGRGLSPFASVTAQDSRNNLKVKESFRRDFPYRGRVSKYELLQSDGTTIEDNQYTWQAHTIGSGYQNYHVPYLAQSIEKNFEVGGMFNGDQIDEVNTSFVVDTYGTATTIDAVSTEKSTANGLQSGATYSEKIVHTGINNNTTSWCLGKPNQTQSINSHTHDATYGAQIMRTVTRLWTTSSKCRIDQEIFEPSSSTHKVTRLTTYDAFGNRNSEAVTGVGMSPRVSSTNWGTTGQFPETFYNALSHTNTIAWDPAHGVKTSQTDPNGLTTSWDHDLFGRKTRETRPDGTYTDYALSECDLANNYCGTAYDRVLTKVRTSEKRSNGTEIRFDDVYLDKLARPVQVENQSLSGAVSRSRTIYDSLGRVYQRSAPSFLSTPAYYSTATYDDIDRLTQVERPIDATDPTLQYVNVTYEGLTSTTNDAEGKNSITVNDVLGRVYRSEDHDGYYQEFEFDAFGSLRRAYDGTNELLSATYVYGAKAFKATWNDMDLGSWSYTHNALGEVVGYTDAKSQSFSATYDLLSRPLTRVEPDNTTTWIWGNSSAAHNIGRLSSISNGSHSESYSYDSLGRIEQRTTVADTTYLTNYGYDSTAGWLDSLTYPVSTSSYRLKLKYDYDYGVLQSVSDFNAPTTVFWTADGVDALGYVIQETLGNGLVTNRVYDPVTGLIDSVQSGPGGGTVRQDMEFQWNKVGSLTQREDLNRSLIEDFFYDNLHRLDYSKLNNVQNLDLSYDLLGMGNIETKSDVGGGSYSYHATKKHAVTSAGGNTFTYDDNGNQITRNADDLIWTSYNYPSQIENGSNTHDFFYDGNRNRWKQVYSNGTDTETTIYVGGILEKRSEGTYTEFRQYIKVAGKSVALYTRASTGTNTTRYFLHDYLGSVAEITTDIGTLDVGESLAAFGARRDATDWSGPVSAGDAAAIADATQRGYTFHSHLEAGPLVHMNGRVMDSVTGRFISPDPYIPQASFSQSFNRYSYVFNNPMSFTDPSGFTPTFDLEWGRDGGRVTISIGIGGRSHSKIPARAKRKGCFVPNASACYGKGTANDPFEIVFDVPKSPLPGYDIPDYLILNVWDGAEPIGKWENFKLFVWDFGEGVVFEFVIEPAKDAAAGKVLAVVCNLAKPCKALKKLGQAAGSAIDKIRRRADDVPNARVHGNSSASTNPQHRYEIADDSGDVVKTGVSGQPLNQNGTSRRANSQVNALNRADDGANYSSNVVESNVPGRQAILDSERAATNQLARDGNTLRLQQRPKPDQGI